METTANAIEPSAAPKKTITVDTAALSLSGLTLLRDQATYALADSTGTDERRAGIEKDLAAINAAMQELLA
jgi:hypothetical protein